MMALEPRGEDRFVATGPRYPWGFLYGGQVVAQAVRAAAAGVRPEAQPHSLHVYYLRAGDDSAPVELAVERVRDGRAFSVRSVTAGQAGRAIASAVVSFHVDECADPPRGLSSPWASRPEELAGDGWSPHFERRYAPVTQPARALAWLRMNEPIGDRPLLQACALAYMADDIPDDAVAAMLRPDERPSTTSLDFAAWFHRPIHTDGWLLHDFRCQALANACAMVVGEVFDQRGAHVATIGQQVLVR